MTGRLPRRALLSAPLLAAPARAQRGPRLVLAVISLPEADPEAAARVASLRAGFRAAGLTEGEQFRLEFRWSGGGPDRVEALAAEAVALRPDLIIVNGGTATRALQRATTSIPVVFQYTSDPVGAGFVREMARPGGNLTGFTAFAPGMPQKWLDLLRQLRPGMRRLFLLAADNPSAQIFPAAGLPGVETLRLRIAGDADVEQAFQRIGQPEGAGLLVVPSSIASTRRWRIAALAHAARLPAVYGQRVFVPAGGLMSYSVDLDRQFRDVAGYAARILAGARPGDLPVQALTRFELALNLATARAIGIEIPTALLAAADEVIE